MGETEGKKEEADYKRLQTFPLVRVSLRKEGSGCWAHRLQVGGACSEETRALLAPPQTLTSQ